MHGESDTADRSVICPAPVLCHQKNDLVGELGSRVLHGELEWGMDSQKRSPSDSSLVMGIPGSHCCYPPSGGDHAIPRWIQGLVGSFGVMSRSSVRGWSICYTEHAFVFDCLTSQVSHLNIVLDCGFFLHLYWNKKKYEVALIPLFPVITVFLT